MAKNKNAINWDVDFIKENYNTMKLVEMAEILSKKDSRINAKNLSRQCKKMNLSKLTMINDIKLKDDEEFKPIPGFKNYEVSQYGNVHCLITGSIVADIIDGKGYHIRKITDSSNIKRDMPLHRLIALAWIYNDDPVNKTQVDHIDGNKDNNSLKNLEWVTPQENINRARQNKLNNSKPSDHTRMDKDTVKKLYLYCKNNPGYTTKDVSKMFKCSQATVRNIMSGKRHADVTRGL